MSLNVALTLLAALKKKKEGGNLVTEFAGEGWDDLLKQLIDKVRSSSWGSLLLLRLSSGSRKLSYSEVLPESVD